MAEDCLWPTDNIPPLKPPPKSGSSSLFVLRRLAIFHGIVSKFSHRWEIMGKGLCIPLENPYRPPRIFPSVKTRPRHAANRTRPPPAPDESSPCRPDETGIWLEPGGGGGVWMLGKARLWKNIVLKTNVLQLFYKKYFAMLQNVRTFAPDFKSEIVPNAAFV